MGNSAMCILMRKIMDQRVHSVPGIPCLYCYIYRTGDRRYFIKTQFKGRIYVKNLEVSQRVTINKLKRLAKEAVLKIKKTANKSMTAWIEEYIVLRQLKPKTALEYRRILCKYSLDNEANHKLFMQTVAAKRNLCQIARTVNAFFRWLIEIGVSVRNPAALIKLPKARTRRRCLSHREVQQLYREILKENSELQLLTHLLCETGARISSILSLKVSDFRKDGLHLFNVKCDHAYPHAVPLSRETKQLWDNVVANKKGAVFSGSGAGIKRRLRIILDCLFNQDSGAERIVIHSLRHTAATLALQAGIPLELVGQMLDHININTTYQIYAQPSQRQIRHAFGVLHQSYGR